MSGSRNRSAGHKWERDSCKLVINEFPDVVTSRAESRNRDDQGVDLCYTGFLNIQCKTLVQKVDYPKVLSEMPEEEGQINVIFDRKTKKVGKRFMVEGEYAHLHLGDFLNLIRKICSEQ